MSASQKPKIALIGPVLPYRGGIAQYTTELHKTLGKYAELRTFSFKRLYPAFLYPGKTDKEPGMEGYKEPGVSYALSIFSPFSWHRTATRIAKSGSKVAIIDWWTLIWQPGFAYIAWVLKRKNVKTIFLCHNLFDHDSKGFKRKMSEAFLRRGDGYIVHSSEEAQILAELYPDAPVMRRNILPIDDQLPKATKTLKRRGRLELLFFGFIRPYKGLHVLVEALAKLQDKEVYLTVAGEAWGDVGALKQHLESMGAPNLDLRLEYVGRAEAANYFERADAVVLPYLTATGSGVLSLAYYYKKPVITTSVGGFKDAVHEDQTGWLVPPNDADALKEAIQKITRQSAVAMAPAIALFCADNSWSNMAKDLIAFAERVAD